MIELPMDCKRQTSLGVAFGTLASFILFLCYFENDDAVKGMTKKFVSNVYNNIIV
jgi:hypothetical protein